MIKPSTLLKSERLGVVDALRGFALMAIVLLHNLEHYNIYHLPEGQPSWLDRERRSPLSPCCSGSVFSYRWITRPGRVMISG